MIFVVTTYLDSGFRKSELRGQGLPGRDVRVLASQKRPLQPFQLLPRERGPTTPLFSGDDDARFGRYVRVAGSSCKSLRIDLLSAFAYTYTRARRLFIYFVAERLVVQLVRLTSTYNYEYKHNSTF